MAIITPNWLLPEGVSACYTTRTEGFSEAPFNDFNVGDHVNDSIDAVAKNREKLNQFIGVDTTIQWLNQVHGTTVASVSHATGAFTADSIITSQAGIACAVMTADCLPVLLTNTAGTEIAAVHCGWRSLVNGVLENTLATMQSDSGDICAWLGPAIGADHFEVGDDVREAFLSKSHITDKQITAKAFTSSNNRWLADIYQLAQIRLQRLGVQQITSHEQCTICYPEHYFSYRRDGVCGRMATLIWIKPT